MFEGGVVILCRAVGSNFVLGLALRKAAQKIFTFIIPGPKIMG